MLLPQVLGHPGPLRASQECMLVFQAEQALLYMSTFAHTFVLGIKMFTILAVSVYCSP